MQEAAKIARANGTKVAVFAHNDPESLERTLEGLRPYRSALVCIDGVYSMSGKIPPMAELNEVARGCDAVLYIDDAHGTGVLGRAGPGYGARSPGQLRQRLRGRVALQGVLLRRGLHRLSRAISSAAQDPIEPLRLRRAGRSLLSRSNRDRHRHPPLRRV